MTRLRSVLIAATVVAVLALPTGAATAAQPVSVQAWCLAPGNVVTLKIGWPPKWSTVTIDASGYAVGVGDSVHHPVGNPVTVKGSTFTWTWVTAYPTANHFASVDLFTRSSKSGGPQEHYRTTIQGALRAC